jgi:hypothetical protein
MLTQTVVAKDWNCTQRYVSKCVARGCPLTSLADARDWRKTHASSRSSTHPKQIAQQVVEEMENDSPQAGESRKKYFEDRPDLSLVLAKDLEDALYHSIELEHEAYRLARDAMIEEKESKIQIRLAIHNKAQENRVKIETMIREEREQRKELIPYNVAADIFRRGLDVILRRLKRFPQEKASACNPQHPVHALGILELGIDSIITEAQGQYAVLGLRKSSQH